MEFIVGLTDHKLFGWIANAYMVNFYAHKSYISIESKISVYNIDKYQEDFNEPQIELARLIEEYSDQTLYKLFCKKKKQTVIDFISSLDAKFARQFIRPYIEKRLIKILDLIADAGFNLYFRGKQKLINKDDRIKINKGYSDIVLNIDKREEGTKYFLSITYNDLDINLLHKAGYFILENPCRFILGNELYYFEDISAKKLTPFFTKNFITVPATSEQKWYESFALENIKKHPVKAKGFEIINKDIIPTTSLSIETNLNGDAILKLIFTYDKQEYLYKKPPFIHVELHKSNNTFSFEKTIRDQQYEESIHQFLLKEGLKKSSFDSLLSVSSSGPVDSEDSIYQIIGWLQNHKQILLNKNISLVQNSLEKIFSVEKSALKIGVTEEKDWFDISITVSIGEFRIPFVKFRKNIINQIKEYLLPNKEVFIIPDEWFSKYIDVLTYGKNESNKLQLSKHHFKLLGTTITGSEKQVEKYKSLQDLKKTNFDLPKTIQANLRDYQVQGYTWMRLLQQNRFGGCLADDMGLGKTI